MDNMLRGDTTTGQIAEGMRRARVFVGFSIVRKNDRTLGGFLSKGKNRVNHREGANIVGPGNECYSLVQLGNNNAERYSWNIQAAS